jgi:exopolyphosphatase/guanosine-5'-triphosphate,3'-diphosphate pyrophosphatase
MIEMEGPPGGEVTATDRPMLSTGLPVSAFGPAVQSPEHLDRDDGPSLADRADVLRKPPPAKFGAIDVGTNSIHLLMVEISPDGDFHVLGRDKELVQLGRGGFREHRLTASKMEEGILTLKRFIKMAGLKDIGRLKAVATSAVREARNGGEFVERVRDELMLDVHVISAEEEARLIYLGVRHAVDLGEPKSLIFDIGGGSVELIVGNVHRADFMTSVKLGASRLAEMFLRSDPPTDDELKTIRNYIHQHLDPLFERIRGSRPVRCIGTSGTVRNIATICAYRNGVVEVDRGKPLSLGRGDLKAIMSEAVGMSRAPRLKIPGMDERRADAFVPAVFLLWSIMRSLDLEQIEYCESALREGIVVDYIARHRYHLLARATWPDPRARSVINLAERCGYRRRHAEQVASLALSLFDQLRGLHHLSDYYRDLLKYACLLHDIGYLIGHTAHHKHSYDLIRHGELRGFSDQEIEVIANIARYHRKERPRKSHYSYQQLDEEHQRAVRRLAVLIRLAEALDRTHYGVVDSLFCDVQEDRVKLLVRTENDAELELWTTKRQRSLFEREFDSPLDVDLDERIAEKTAPC